MFIIAFMAKASCEFGFRQGPGWIQTLACSPPATLPLHPGISHDMKYVNNQQVFTACLVLCVHDCLL